MVKEFNQIWDILNKGQRRQLKILQIFVILISLFEIVTVVTIAGFMHFLNNVVEIMGYSFIPVICDKLNLSQNNLLMLISIGVLLLLTGSSVFSVWLTKRINYSAFSIGREISVQLFRLYQNQNWIYHTQVNSSQLINRTLTETNRLTTSVLLPLLLLVSKIVLILLITISLLVYNPLVSIGGALLCTSGYYILFFLSKSRLATNSVEISRSNQDRIRTLNEGFEGIKHIILSNKHEYYINKYNKACKTMADGQASTVTISAAPRYMMEWLAYVGVISLLLIFILIHGKDISDIIPMLTVYGISIFKLLPAMQQAYSNLATIKGNFSVVSELSEDIILSNDCSKQEILPLVLFDNFFELRNVSFQYPNKSIYAINDISIKIKKNTCVGFVGPSGSGKSTLIDILCGLIEVKTGQFIVDDTVISSQLSSWRHNIAYVPQSIVLTDSSIIENIAFGIHVDNIDRDKVKATLKQTHLEELINSLDDGLNTIIGERGVQLSGGQRQRIGIARALYTGADILVFDEATSALDGITEKLIMDAISNFSGSKTILLIAHRLKTVKACDKIYFIDDGKINDSGTYSELLGRNKQFSEMVLHS